MLLGIALAPFQYLVRAYVVWRLLGLISGISFHGSFLQALWMSIALMLITLALTTTVVIGTMLLYVLARPIVKRINPTWAEKFELKATLDGHQRSTKNKLQFSTGRPTKELLLEGLTLNGILLTLFYKMLSLFIFAHFYPFLFVMQSLNSAILASVALSALDKVLNLVFNLLTVTVIFLEKKKAETVHETSENQSAPTRANKFTTLWSKALEVQEERELRLAPYNLEVQLSPNNPSTYVERGKVNLSIEERAAAYEDFSKAIKLDAGCAEARHRRGEVLARMGLNHLSIEDLGQSCRLYKEQNNPTAWKEANAKLEELNAQLASPKSLVQSSKETVATTKFLFQPEAFHEIQKLKIESADKELGENAFSAPVYCQRAQALLNEKQYQKALDDYTRALQLRPEYADALRGRGDAWFGLGNYEKSIADYTEALALSANDADSYRGRSFAYSCTGKLEEALADMTMAMKFSPSNDLKFIRAQILTDLRRNAEALDDLNDFISTRESAIMVWSFFILPVFREIAFQLKAALPEAYRMRSKLHEEAGNQALAAADMAAVQKIEKEVSKRKSRLA